MRGENGWRISAGINDPSTQQETEREGRRNGERGRVTEQRVVSVAAVTADYFRV
jgi:hypothetical protein